MRYLSFFLLALLSSCGGSGNGDVDFVGAANVKLSVSPTAIDTGDRLRVRVNISDTNLNDLIIKIRYPDSLAYVPSSASIDYQDDPEDATPSFNQTADGESYLVFFVSSENFEDFDEATLEVQLRALNDLKGGQLEVDADVDDPLISNNREFDINQPDFTAEDAVTIKVLGEK